MNDLKRAAVDVVDAVLAAPKLHRKVIKLLAGVCPDVAQLAIAPIRKAVTAAAHWR